MPSSSTVEKLLCERIDASSSNPTVRQYRKFVTFVGKYREPTLDPRAWIENYCFIEHKKTGKFELVRLNRPQLELLAAILDAVRQGIPFRAFILKARRWGISRFMLLYLLREVLHGSHFNAAVVANTKRVASSLLDQVRFKLLKNLPYQPPVIRSNLGRVSFALPMGTSLEISSAQEAEPLRGDTMGYRKVHCTETAHWEDALRKAISIHQSVPDEPGTLLCHESTANGNSGFFHDGYWEADAGESNFRSFFFPWFADPAYDYCIAVNNLEAEQLLATMDDEEKDLFARGVNVGSLAWRRWAIVNKCAGDRTYFDQEYPTTAKSAFRTGGLRAFSVLHMERALNDCTKPIRRVDIEITGKKKGKITYELVPERRDPCLSVWQEPELDKDYVIGADCGEGVGGDFSEFHVLCVQTQRQVARWRSNRRNTTDFARQICVVAQMYNDALVLIERKQPGQAVIVSAGEFANVHLCLMPTFATSNPDLTERIGWDSNAASKPIAVGAIREALIHNVPTIVDASLIQQMSTMRVVPMPSGYEKLEKTPGTDDDGVDAWGITLMCLRFAVETRYYDPEKKPQPRTYDEYAWADFTQMLERRRQEEEGTDAIIEDGEQIIEDQSEEDEDV